METTTANVTPREQALIAALRAIVMETADYPEKIPESYDSYLPFEFIIAAEKALAAYGVQS